MPCETACARYRACMRVALACVQCGHLCNMATCLIWPVVQYGHLSKCRRRLRLACPSTSPTTMTSSIQLSCVRACVRACMRARANNRTCLALHAPACPCMCMCIGRRCFLAPLTLCCQHTCLCVCLHTCPFAQPSESTKEFWHYGVLALRIVGTEQCFLTSACTKECCLRSVGTMERCLRSVGTAEWS